MTISRIWSPIVAGLVSFIVVCGGLLGAVYVVLMYLLPRPSTWAELTINVEGMIAFFVAVATGSVSAGYAIAKTSPRAPYIRSILLAALLACAHYLYSYWGSSNLWDIFTDICWGCNWTWSSIVGTIAALAACLAFCVLGTWIGLRGPKDSKLTTSAKSPTI